jgi:hypothetical protein
MCDTIRRMLEGTRPIDLWMLVIELLVLLLIAYEVVVGVWSKVRTSRRVATIFRYMAQGQNLQANAPPAGTTDISIPTAWVESVKEWIQQTHNALTQYSPQAAASFIHDSGGASVQYNSVSGHSQARDWYRVLILRINNLRSIMEKPNVYF